VLRLVFAPSAFCSVCGGGIAGLHPVMHLHLHGRVVNAGQVYPVGKVLVEKVLGGGMGCPVVLSGGVEPNPDPISRGFVGLREMR
jgi:hypothetical protein